MRVNGLRSLSGALNDLDDRQKFGLTALGATNKMFWSETHRDTLELAIDVLGMDGQILTGKGDEDFVPGIGRREAARDYPVSPLQASFFFSRSETIWGGTAEIQRNIVGERVLGLPKEPKPARLTASVTRSQCRIVPSCPPRHGADAVPRARRCCCRSASSSRSCACSAQPGVGYAYVRYNSITRYDVALPPAAEGEPRNFLLVGSDSREGLDPDRRRLRGFVNDGVDEGAGQRTDTIMVLRVDPDTEQADLLSLPRDLYLPIGGPDGPKDRINAAFAAGPPDVDRHHPERPRHPDPPLCRGRLRWLQGHGRRHRRSRRLLRRRAARPEHRSRHLESGLCVPRPHRSTPVRAVTAPRDPPGRRVGERSDRRPRTDHPTAAVHPPSRGQGIEQGTDQSRPAQRARGRRSRQRGPRPWSRGHRPA